MSRETFAYDELILGDCNGLEITINAGQVISKGDLLIASGDGFVKDTTGATMGKVYCIASEDVDATDDATITFAYFNGKFGKDAVTKQATKASEYVLATQGIFLVATR